MFPSTRKPDSPSRYYERKFARETNQLLPAKGRNYFSFFSNKNIFCPIHVLPDNCSVETRISPENGIGGSWGNDHILKLDDEIMVICSGGK